MNSQFQKLMGSGMKQKIPPIQIWMEVDLKSLFTLEVNKIK